LTQRPASIPRPLVRTNQWVIFLSVVSAWLTGPIWILLIPLLAGLLGLIFHFNPVMKLAATFLKKDPSEYIPEDIDQQHFNQMIAIVLLTASLIAYILNWTTLSFIASILVAAASLIAILGFCIGCFIRFKWQQFQYRRTKNE
jgi:hypothetical protein